MLTTLNQILWIAVSLLIFITGIVFTIKIKGAQFNLKKMWSYLKEEKTGGISPVQTLTLNLAARIGVGSISGIALAIYIGGPGTIFWMWITAFIASANTYLESIFAVIFHEKDASDVYYGGPSQYIDKGLKNKPLAKLYSLIIMITFLCGFLTIQSNTITVGITNLISIHPLIIGLVLAIIIAIIIMKGIKRIANVTNVLVPLMGFLYFILCFIIIIQNISNLPTIFSLIFKDAFQIKTAGIGILSTFLIGMQRGIFSNEAGIGTGAITAATIDTKHPESQGAIQTLGIYIDTLIVGTLTSIVIMCSNYQSLNIIDVNGIEIATNAFSNYFGSAGNILMMLIIILFAIATIITGYYYGESSFKYLKKKVTKKQLTILKLFAISMIIIGSILPSTKLWEFNDLLIALLALINTYALWKLKEKL